MDPLHQFDTLFQRLPLVAILRGLTPAEAPAIGAALTGAAAVTFAPAARHHGLAFIPVETHDVELWIGERWLDHPGAEALLGLIRGDAFRVRVGLVGGYDLEGTGEWAG